MNYVGVKNVLKNQNTLSFSHNALCFSLFPSKICPIIARLALPNVIAIPLPHA